MAKASQLVDLSYEAWLEAFFAWKPINGRPGGHIWAAKDKTSTIVNTVQIHVNNTNTYISVKMHYKYNGPPIPCFFGTDSNSMGEQLDTFGHIIRECQDQVEERWYPHLAKLSSSMHAR